MALNASKTTTRTHEAKSESGNFQEIVLYKGVGFVISPGIKVSVVRSDCT